MKFLITLIILFSSTAAFAEDPAVKAPLTVQQFRATLPEDDSQELDLQGLLKLQKEGPVTVLDVRAADHFARQHLKGSVNMPLTELTEKTLPTIAPDKDVPIALACDYSFMPTRMIAMTMQAYPVLKANGYKKIYRLNLWKSSDGKMLSDEEQKKYLTFESAEEKPVPAAPTPEEPVMCTMEAKACPDGSYVSRTGLHCEFAACPK
jgi:rhodanese-related sulfurtransferase